MWTVRVTKKNVVCSLGRPITTACISNQEVRAEYPPIVDVRPEAKTLQNELSSHEKIRNLNTIEEKAIGVNMPRFNRIILSCTSIITKYLLIKNINYDF